ncbi:hypothetical protein PV10_03798 [Exophiala mesophila]|uniref:MARVEL domain-containing protein n=1 Tax=Exophiala mesophila TaxID=212818 RepID=A0A0D1ZCY7_EXOME|nr:uncharacterized protein PV10_03798 [Exophiala mesophila]KIV92507.1 hypothetical protein PV10_03798 [Exophiala mesophila]
MALGGAILRFSQIGVRGLQFCCAAIILGIYSYFLAVLTNHDINIPTWEKAVTGMSGSAVLYTIFGFLFTLCLGGIAFLSYIAIFLDICFIGCFAAIAYYTRHGANSCQGIVNTPIGTGLSNEEAPGAGDWGYVCSLNTACFAVSILGIFLFIASAGLQFLLARRHKKDKAFGPSPNNDYTAGPGRRPFWKRSRKVQDTRDAEAATAHAGHHHTLGRHSHETGMTGSTMHGGNVPLTSEPKYGQPGYGMEGYSAPTGVAR